MKKITFEEIVERVIRLEKASNQKEQEKELDASCNRGRYMVISYFLNLIKTRPGNTTDAQIIEAMTDVFEKEIKKLAWVKEEMEQVQKELSNFDRMKVNNLGEQKL